MSSKRTRIRGLSVLIAVLPLGCASIVGADFEEKTLCLPGNSGASVKSIAAGHQHTCAVMSDDRVRCWGSNASGQLGIGTTDSMPHTEPTEVPCLVDVVQVAAGKSHTCALTLLRSEVFCWGDNQRGQLGVSDFEPYPSPRKVPLEMAGVPLQIAAGDDFTCARMESGLVFCWGANDRKQLGADVSEEDSAIPAGALLGEALSIAAGSGHACARTSKGEGEIVCWGSNGDGQTGAAPTPNVAVPASITKAPAANDLSAGGLHSCLLTSDGIAHCWGSNSNGQLGTGSMLSNNHDPEPVEFSIGTGFSAISLGGLHSCAITKQQDVFCWGENASGQLGTGNDPQSEPPVVAVHPEEGATALALGSAHSCVLTAHAVKCWGDNAAGQLGVPSLEPVLAPVDVLTW